MMNVDYQYLDLVPKGRDENGDVARHLSLAGRELSRELVHALANRGERCCKLLHIG